MAIRTHVYRVLVAGWLLGTYTPGHTAATSHAFHAGCTGTGITSSTQVESWVTEAKAFISDAMEAANSNARASAAKAEQVERQLTACIAKLNEAMPLAFSSNQKALDAHQQVTKLMAEAQRATTLAREAIAAMANAEQLPAQIEKLTADATKNLSNEYERLKELLSSVLHKHDNDALAHDIKVAQEIIKEKERLGVFKQKAQAKAQAAVDVEKTKWENIRKTIDDPMRIAKIIGAIAATAATIYVLKHTITHAVHYFTAPRVICETSQGCWFGPNNQQDCLDLNDLIVPPALHKQLFDLADRVQAAHAYNEALPNVLIYGQPGTGKTAFVRALAEYSGLDYALTSGSEFAKITDPNLANNELRKLLKWGEGSSKGLIIFIDEAEILFASKKTASTTIATQNFINTFLSLVPDASQKQFMFIFSSNHPYKIDDAVLNRIGIKIEFVLPTAIERAKILALYLASFADENENAPVSISPDVIEQLTYYGAQSAGLCPRVLKFIAEEMVIAARRQAPKQVTLEIAQTVFARAQQALAQTIAWDAERQSYANAQGQ
jgi:predicted AAA+ superfamily ATPase